jgi:hypothetical protein
MIVALPLLSLLLLRPTDSLVIRHEKPLADNVTLTLAADRSSYYVGEPLSLEISVTNVGDKPVRGCFMIDPATHKAEVYYRSPGSDLSRLKYLDLQHDYVESLRTLKPGEEEKVSVVVGFDPAQQTLILEKPGEYEFQVVYRDIPKEPNGVLRSNVVRVQVSDVPEAEREAFTSYSRDLAMLAQFDPRRSYAGPEAIKTAVDFLDRFPNSPYSGHLRHGLERALKDRVALNRATKEERALYQQLQAERIPNQ